MLNRCGKNSPDSNGTNWHVNVCTPGDIVTSSATLIFKSSVSLYDCIATGDANSCNSGWSVRVKSRTVIGPRSLLVTSISSWMGRPTCSSQHGSNSCSSCTVLLNGVILVEGLRSLMSNHWSAGKISSAACVEEQG
jgi:hypothetical protein